jgi:hypothetical protein
MIIFGGMESLTDIVITLMVFMLIYNILRDTGLLNSLGWISKYSYLQRLRNKGKIVPDGTLRDLEAVINSCKLNETIARRIRTDTKGDKDIRNQLVGKVLGVCKENVYTAFWVRKGIKRFVLICRNDMISSIDMIEIRLEARSIRTWDGDFYFPVPLRSSRWSGDHNKYKDWINDVREQITIMRLRGDRFTEIDYSIKKSIRENGFVTPMEEIGGIEEVDAGETDKTD